MVSDLKLSFVLNIQQRQIGIIRIRNKLHFADKLYKVDTSRKSRPYWSCNRGFVGLITQGSVVLTRVVIMIRLQHEFIAYTYTQDSSHVVAR